MPRRKAVSSPGRPAEPWRSFLGQVDAGLTSKVHLCCFGGFVVTQLYGLPRQTSDIDFLTISPLAQRSRLMQLAGWGSALQQQYKLYVQHVAVATLPVEYESRLRPMFREAGWRRLRLSGVEPHDLALSKIERNLDRDREDVQLLNARGHLQAEVLQSRYQQELRPYLPNVERHDLTLQLWLEMCWPTG